MDKPLIVLSHVQASVLLRGQQARKSSLPISTDLGLTTVEVSLDSDHIAFPDGHLLTWEGVERIRKSSNNCFLLEGDELRKIRIFSEATNRPISLKPTENAPTMLVAGLPMHRIKGTEPFQDTLTKIKALSPVAGLVLDTATGLGYTAIEASKTADKVVTIEIDPAVLEVARLNPWSRGLFDNPKIEIRVGNSVEEVSGFESGSFDRIIHDPPTFSLAGDLYSADFYQMLFRILRPGGRIFHYIGDPESRLGRRVTKGAIRRLEGVGFRRVSGRPEAFGLVAHKPRMA